MRSLRALLAILPALILAGCALFQGLFNQVTTGNKNGIGTPSPGQWLNFAANQSTKLSNPFPIGTNPILGYVYTAPLPGFVQGARITLNYTVTGNPNYIIHDPTDGPPASITLFAWEKGDDLSCNGGFVSYRMWNGARGSLDPGSHTLSAVIDGATWTNCYGQTDPQGFAQLLSNILGVGFTFGGRNFFGHGVTNTNPGVSFKIDGFGTSASTRFKFNADHR